MWDLQHRVFATILYLVGSFACRLRYFLVFAVGAAGLNAQAQSFDEAAIRSCAFIEDNQLRLRCFDQLVERDTLISGIEQQVHTVPEPDLKRVEGLALFSSAAYDSSLGWFDQRWELSPASKRGSFQIRPYKPVYMLPLFFNSNPNDNPRSPNPLNVVPNSQNLDATEAKFQLSLKTKLGQNLFGHNADIWFGYTQSSRWQVYNDNVSRPFRETNYEPEFMLTAATSWSAFQQISGWDLKMLGLSLNHQSNGRELPFSRSWNRIIGIAGFEKGDTLLQVRPWARLPENAEDDDNPDIADYVGRIDYLLVHKNQGHEYSLLMRHNMRFNGDSRGAIQLDWAFPLEGNLRGHLQWFSGYGESLIDYNHRSDYLGMGVSLIGWY